MARMTIFENPDDYSAFMRVLDQAKYPLKTKITTQELKAVRLLQNKLHGEWNYEI